MVSPNRMQEEHVTVHVWWIEAPGKATIMAFSLQIKEYLQWTELTCPEKSFWCLWCKNLKKVVREAAFCQTCASTSSWLWHWKTSTSKVDCDCCWGCTIPRQNKRIPYSCPFRRDPVSNRFSCTMFQSKNWMLFKFLLNQRNKASESLNSLKLFTKVKEKLFLQSSINAKNVGVRKFPVKTRSCIWMSVILLQTLRQSASESYVVLFKSAQG